MILLSFSLLYFFDMIDPNYRFHILKPNEFFKFRYFFKHNTMGSNLREGKGERERETGGVMPIGRYDGRVAWACPLSERGQVMDTGDELRVT